MSIKALNRQKAVAGIIWRENKILFVRRNKAPFKDGLHLPGGKVEANETLLQAVQREIKEETGLDIHHWTEGKSYDVDGAFPYSITFFVAKAAPEASIQLNSENSAYMWLSISEILSFKASNDVIFDFNKKIIAEEYCS